jgi:Protein of unknown function (DUF4232)
MKTITTAGVLAVAGALLAACAGQLAPAASGPPQPPPTAHAAPLTARPAPGPAADPAAAPATEPATEPDGGAGLPRCTTGELSVALGAADAAAGSVYYDLVFTNTSAHTCELRGFPGVSYVAGDDGHQVGPAAEMSGERGDQVPIAPGGTARAQLRLANVQNYDPADCSPTPVRGLRIYPPGDTAALFVPREGTGCAKTPPGAQMSVQTITP